MIGPTPDQTPDPSRMLQPPTVSMINHKHFDTGENTFLCENRFVKNWKCFSDIGQARPQLHSTLMQRMTDVLSRMLNDPLTRVALSAGGEDSLAENEQQNESVQTNDSSQSNPPGEDSVEDNENNASSDAVNETVSPAQSPEDVSLSADSAASSITPR